MDYCFLSNGKHWTFLNLLKLTKVVISDFCIYQYSATQNPGVMQSESSADQFLSE